jgi:hypothetical protein
VATTLRLAGSFLPGRDFEAEQITLAPAPAPSPEMEGSKRREEWLVIGRAA